MYYIQLEDLAANTIIKKIKENPEIEPHNLFVSFHDLELYGKKVIENLRNKGERAILLLSRTRTNLIFQYYSDFFVESNCENISGISVAQGKSVNDFIQEFRGYLPLDVLMAFIETPIP